MTAVALSRRPARVLRLEIRRSVVPWAVPLLVALFLFDTYRTAAGLPPVWTVRSSVITDNLLEEFIPFAAGLAAWVGSREGRRKTRDLLATTVRPALARQACALGATLFWLLLVFLAGVVVLYVATALQATWGGPPLWPVAVGRRRRAYGHRGRVHRGRAVPQPVHGSARRDRCSRPGLCGGPRRVRDGRRSRRRTGGTPPLITLAQLP